MAGYEDQVTRYLTWNPVLEVTNTDWLSRRLLRVVEILQADVEIARNPSDQALYRWALRVSIPRPLPCKGSALPLS
jgi:hypothetical protein